MFLRPANPAYVAPACIGLHHFLMQVSPPLTTKTPATWSIFQPLDAPSYHRDSEHTVPFAYPTHSPCSLSLKLAGSGELPVDLAETETDSESVGPGWSLRFCISKKLPAGASAVGLWAAL